MEPMSKIFFALVTQNFEMTAGRHIQKFDISQEEKLPCTFAGFKITGKKSVGFLLDQHHYLKKLEELPYEASYSVFRSARMKLSRLGNSRPDCAFAISQLAQVT